MDKSNNKPTASRKKLAAGELTAQEIKLLDARADIYSTPLDGDDWAFMHSLFCQVGLPRSKVEGREFMRQSGAAWVSAQAGYLDEPGAKGRWRKTHPLRCIAAPRVGARVHLCGT